MKVISRYTGIEYKVYSVNKSQFLIFNNGKFEWCEMSRFYPAEKRGQQD